MGEPLGLGSDRLAPLLAEYGNRNLGGQQPPARVADGNLSGDLLPTVNRAGTEDKVPTERGLGANRLLANGALVHEIAPRAKEG